MGGRAFDKLLPDAKFPRLPPAVYAEFKKQLKSILESIYDKVEVPREAPEKVDYGDLDFIVVNPNVPPENIIPATQHALSAVQVLPANPTSNYAVRLRDIVSERSIVNLAEKGDDTDVFVQVDVHVCPDEAYMERVLFWHGYGDLGMIIGSMIRGFGLQAGTSGLKIYKNPPEVQPYLLAMQPSEIVPFMGLSLERWEQGFSSRLEAYQWVSQSILFNPSRLEPPGKNAEPATRNTKSRHRDGRAMFQQFLEWASEQPKEREGMAVNSQDAIQRALQFFGSEKKDEYEAICATTARRIQIRTMWGGNKVKEWMGLGGEDWRKVKLIVNAVREKEGGDEGVIALGSEEKIRAVVEECTKELEDSGAFDVDEMRQALASNSKA